MGRKLELYNDGRLYEYDGDQTVKVTETQGNVDVIIDTLLFSIAKTLTVAPPDKQPPDVPTPRGSRHINREGLKLITTFEGCYLTAYDDGGGVWTIGCGHTEGVYPGMTITQKQAEQFLAEDLKKFESYVEEAIQVNVTADQFSALVAFCFNVGPGTHGFGGSTLLKLLNQRNYQAAAEQFPRWNKVHGKPWLGLTRRRLAEQALFNSQPWESFRTYNGPVEVFGTPGNRLLKLMEPIMFGEDVRCLQEALLQAGFDIGSEKPDGFFGEKTDQAVRQFQQQKRLKVDGIVGQQTLQALGL